MKTILYIVLVVMVLWYPANKSIAQSESVIFCETYTQQELFTRLEPDDRIFKLLSMEHTDPAGSRIGSCPESGLEALWEYVRSDPFKSKVQADLILATGIEAKEQMIPIYAIRKNPSDQVFPNNKDREAVSVSKSENKGDYSLLITFSESGTQKWASMTRLNKGRDIAMLSNGKVISAPRVTEEIKHGKCMISGKFNESEINSLKASLEN